MTLDEAIAYCLEVAEGYEIRAELGGELTSLIDCPQQAANHRQLAAWLQELKEAKRLLKAAVEDLNEIISTRHDNSQWRYADEALKLIGGGNA